MPYFSSSPSDPVPMLRFSPNGAHRFTSLGIVCRWREMEGLQLRRFRSHELAGDERSVYTS